MKIKEEQGGVIIENDDGTSSFAQTATKDLGSNFQYLQNPSTGKVIAIGKNMLVQAGQGLSNVGGYVPVGADVFNAKPVSTPQPTKTNSDGRTALYVDKNGNPVYETNPLDGINIDGMNISTPSSSTSGVFSSVQDFENRQKAEAERIKAEAQALKEKKGAVIEEQYFPHIREATAEREKITEATKGQFATDRRASTAALSFVDARRSEAQKQINNLVQMKEQALAQLDVNTQESIDKQLKEWRDYELQLSSYFRQATQDDFNNKMALLGYKMNKEQFDETKKTNYLTRQKAEYELASTKLNSLIQTDLTKIDENTKKALETSLSLVPGTFDSIFSELKDIYDLEKQGKIADLAVKISNAQGNLPEGFSLKIGDQEIIGTAKNETTTDYKNWELMGGQTGTNMTFQEFMTNKTSRDGLTDYQTTMMLDKLMTKHNSDVAINQLAKASGLNMIADQVIQNPNDATNQLKSLYILVKNLDPDSAVREGELALAQKTQSYWQQFKTELTRISEGQVISPEAARSLASATKDLTGAWSAQAKYKQGQYRAQAQTLGLQTQFDSFISNIDVNVSGQDNNVNSSEDFWEGMED